MQCGTAAAWLARDHMRERRPPAIGTDAAFVAERVGYE